MSPPHCRRSGADGGIPLAHARRVAGLGRAPGRRPRAIAHVGIYAGALGFGYNSELVDDPAPACWADLLDPRFEDDIQVANPNSSGTSYTMLATMVQLMGEEEAFEYLTELHGNISAYTQSGSAPIRAAATGETAVGIVFQHDAVARPCRARRVVTVAPCEGTGYEVGSMSLIAGGPNPDNAKIWYDWALTPAAQETGAMAGSYQVPSNTNAETPPEAPRLEDVKLIDYDFATYGLERDPHAPARALGRGDRLAAPVTAAPAPSTGPASAGSVFCSSPRWPCRGYAVGGLGASALALGLADRPWLLPVVGIALALAALAATTRDWRRHAALLPLAVAGARGASAAGLRHRVERPRPAGRRPALPPPPRPARRVWARAASLTRFRASRAHLGRGWPRAASAGRERFRLGLRHRDRRPPVALRVLPDPEARRGRLHRRHGRARPSDNSSNASPRRTSGGSPASPRA